MALSKASRQSVLSLALLVVLLASLAAAWAIVRARRIPSTRGEAVIAQIRRQTLEAYWKTGPETDWYITYDAADEPVGWSVYLRWYNDGRYLGAALMQRDGRQQAERWAIDPSALTGEYVGDFGMSPARETHIGLKDGELSVRQPRVPPAKTRAPGNYIPEGLMWLVIAEVSRTDKPAAFCTVFNVAAIQIGQVYFSSVTMTPLGGGKVRVRAAIGNGRIDEIYHVDADGRIAKIEDNVGRGATVLSNAGEVTKVFPEAEQLLPLFGNPSDGSPETDDQDAPPESLSL